MKEFESIINKHLNTLLNEFKKCKSKKKYLELTRTFYIIYEMINKLNLNIDIPNELEYELNKINIDEYYKKYDNDLLDNIDKLYEYNIELSKIGKLLDKRYPEEYNYFEEYIDIKYSIELAKEFFKYYDKNIYDYFINSILDKGLFILNNNIENGITTSSNYILPPYSFMNPSLTAKDFICIVHESAHNYIKNLNRFINNENKNQMLINNLEEVFPSFIELVAIKFLKDNGNLLREIDIYEKLVDRSVINFLNSFNKSLLNKDLDNYKDNEAYSYGRILSYHFFDNYLKDADKTKKDILYFSIEHYNKEYMLNNYGLNQLNLLSTYKLTKYMDKHYSLEK